MADPEWWRRPDLPNRFQDLTFEEIEGPDEAAELRARRAELTAGPATALEAVGRFDPPSQDQVLLDVAVGPAGELISLWCDAPDQHVFVSIKRGRPHAGPGARASRPAVLTIAVHTGDGSRARNFRVPEVELTYPMVSAGPDDSFTIVSRICALRDGCPDQNGIVVDAHGTVLTRMTLGDGVESLQVTRNGRTWVGYSDTGILGNNGWGFSGDEGSARRTPIGSSGLVRFDAHYSPEWEFGRTSRESNQPEGELIDHVYALQVTDEAAWLYYYAANAIARVVDDTIQIWDTDVALAQELVISENRVALSGGYGPDYDRLIVGRLNDTALVRESTGRIVLPDGTDLPTTSRATARGSTLHVVTDGNWYRLTL